MNEEYKIYVVGERAGDMSQRFSRLSANKNRFIGSEHFDGYVPFNSTGNYHLDRAAKIELKKKQLLQQQIQQEYQELEARKVLTALNWVMHDGLKGSFSMLKRMGGKAVAQSFDKLMIEGILGMMSKLDNDFFQD